MEKLKNFILSQVLIEKNSMNNILSVFEPLEIVKGEFFVRSGKICRQMAFIESGYMRMYDIVDGKEITLWIGSDGKFITSLSSFILKQVIIGIYKQLRTVSFTSLTEKTILNLIKQNLSG